jgi:predicted enzyme related to lactoylglutathione lyase
VRVSETFVSIRVAEMVRAVAFYEAALGATVSFASPSWTSIHIAGVRIGLFCDSAHRGGPTGLHFAVDDLDAARAAIASAGGRATAPVEVAPGLVTSEAVDSEGNQITLRA